MRGASTVVTSVVRPIVSTPVPIASKPRDSTHSHKAPPTTQLLIGPATAGGAGYSSSSSSSPNPMSAGAVPGGLVTNLVVGGAFPAQPAVQLFSPSHHYSGHSHSNGPAPLSLLQPQLLPASLAPSAGGKALAQVQYILPTLPKSPSPQLSNHPTSVFTLPTAPPTHVSLANGKQAGASASLAGYAFSPAVGVFW